MKVLDVYDAMPEEFRDALGQAGVTDLAVHDDGQAYITRLGGETEIGNKAKHVPLMLCLAASHRGHVINSSTPSLSCDLPNGERLTGWRPEVGGAWSVVIRVPMRKRPTWEDMIGYGTVTRAMADWIEEKVGQGASIGIVGEQGCGKTHLLSTILGSPHLESKVCALIETVQELMGPKKCKRIIIGPHCSFNEARALLMRTSSKVCIMGEARTPQEMAEVMTTSGTGHQSFTTFHAKNISEAPHRVEDLLRQGGYTQSKEDIHGAIARNFDFFIFMQQQEGGKRVVTDIASLEMKGGIAVRKEVEGLNKRGEL